MASVSQVCQVAASKASVLALVLVLVLAQRQVRVGGAGQAGTGRGEAAGEASCSFRRRAVHPSRSKMQALIFPHCACKSPFARSHLLYHSACSHPLPDALCAPTSHLG